MRILDEPGYVLRKQEYGETSYLVDVFTRQHGRFRIVAKGVRSGKGLRARALQPFQKLNLGWSGRTELKTLTQLEPLSYLNFNRDAMACAFYINELLWNLLEIQDPHEELFDCYDQTLSALVEAKNLEPQLRSFEFVLLQEIGYGLALDLDSTTQDCILPDQRYRFQGEQGLIPTDQSDQSGVQGKFFLAMANLDFSDKDTLVQAKRLTRHIIHTLLDGRELHSRKWFRNKVDANV